MNIYLKVLIILILFMNVTSCSEKIYYSGKILNINEDINNFKTKNEVIKKLGSPNYIDIIEEKFFYYSEKRLTKNFYSNEIIDRTLLVFHFNLDGTIKYFKQINLNNENQIDIIEEQTSDVIVKQGLLEKIFGGVGTDAIPITQ